MSGIGVMVCGHGSRDVNAVEEFNAVARGLRERLPRYRVESGFLEFATPIIRDGLDKLHRSGHDLVLAVPGMLFAAGHAKNDIPSVLRTYEAGHPGMEIRYARELGIDPKMLRAAGDRIRQALDRAGGDVPLHETMLVVVGRGTSDSDANSNVNKVMRMLWEGFGFGWGEVCYSGVTFPLVEPGLRHAARLGYRRIVVFPYFLFTGVLVKRIYDHTDKVAAQHPEIEFLKAGYLNDHPMVLDAFTDRVREILDGENNMNCKLCKYREQILGFEAEVGLPQESHHHHVEGIGTGDHGRSSDHSQAGDHHHSDDDPRAGDPPHSDDHPQAPDRHHTHDHPHGGGHHHHGHDHHHGQDHAHTHHPYPHADHPHGPRSMTGD